MSNQEIKISNTNANSYQDSVVRVYVDGVKIVEVFINVRNPLGYLQDRNSSKHLVDFRDQLVEAMESKEISIETALEIIEIAKLSISI